MDNTPGDMDNIGKECRLPFIYTFLQAHKQHLGKIRTEDTNRLQLTIPPQNTIVQMIRIVTPRMI